MINSSVPMINNKIWLYIEVDGDPGLDNSRLSKIDISTFEEIEPILGKIKELGGWFPTGDFLYPATIGSSPWQVYAREFGEEAYDTLIKLMPRPESGWRKVVCVYFWNVEPWSLDIPDIQIKNNGKKDCC